MRSSRSPLIATVCAILIKRALQACCMNGGDAPAVNDDREVGCLNPRLSSRCFMSEFSVDAGRS